MRSTDTSGNEYIFIDQCACCELDTGGNHRGYCPLYGQPTVMVFPLWRDGLDFSPKEREGKLDYGLE